MEPKEEAILARLKTIAQEQLNMTPEQVAHIGLEAPLIDTLRLDSLSQVVLVTAVEEDFGATFDPEQWQQLETVGDLVKMLSGLRPKEAHETA